MTHDLGPAARALLDAAREGAGPDAAAIRRMRDKIDASVAGGGAASAVAAKLGVVAVVAALAIGAFVYSRRGDDAIAPRIELPAQLRAEVENGPPAREAPPPAETGDPGEIEMAPVVRGEAPRPAPRAAPVAVPEPRAVDEVEPAAPARADLAREVELVDLAMAALRRADTAGALAAVRAHAAETGGAGQLAEDAAAIEIEALCRLRHAAVPAKLAAFDAAWPGSAQRARLSARCR